MLECCWNCLHYDSFASVCTSLKSTVNANELCNRFSSYDDLSDTIKVQYWIDVNKILPKLGERVLFATPHFSGEGYLSESKKWYRYDSIDIELIFNEPVTHWMSIPKPPKGINKIWRINI